MADVPPPGWAARCTAAVSRGPGSGRVGRPGADGPAASGPPAAGPVGCAGEATIGIGPYAGPAVSSVLSRDEALAGSEVSGAPRTGRPGAAPPVAARCTAVPGCATVPDGRAWAPVRCTEAGSEVLEVVEVSEVLGVSEVPGVSDGSDVLGLSDGRAPTPGSTADPDAPGASGASEEPAERPTGRSAARCSERGGITATARVGSDRGRGATVSGVPTRRGSTGRSCPADDPAVPSAAAGSAGAPPSPVAADRTGSRRGVAPDRWTCRTSPRPTATSGPSASGCAAGSGAAAGPAATAYRSAGPSAPPTAAGPRGRATARRIPAGADGSTAWPSAPDSEGFCQEASRDRNRRPSLTPVAGPARVGASGATARQPPSGAGTSAWGTSDRGAGAASPSSPVRRRPNLLRIPMPLTRLR
ncbi:hypothetical protein ACIOJE_29545 [Kitasatospora sp. NPDC087861]|uniref:hypothetical protein n=1 Tax=Kitasatospora sp. NPDC087861 TaxID=3364070 RepID=UPI0037FCC67C